MKRLPLCLILFVVLALAACGTAPINNTYTSAVISTRPDMPADVRAGCPPIPNADISDGGLLYKAYTDLAVMYGSCATRDASKVQWFDATKTVTPPPAAK